jgi:hypothetical protein
MEDEGRVWGGGGGGEGGGYSQLVWETNQRLLLGKRGGGCKPFETDINWRGNKVNMFPNSGSWGEYIYLVTSM